MAPRKLRLRYEGCIADKLVDKLSYEGEPQTREQLLELTKSMMDQLMQTIPGVPILAEHGQFSGPTEIGKVDRCFYDDKGRAMIHFYLHDSEPGRMAHAALKANLLKGLSLSHNRKTMQAGEVSLCLKGARDNTEVTASEWVRASKSKPKKNNREGTQVSLKLGDLVRLIAPSETANTEEEQDLTTRVLNVPVKPLEAFVSEPAEPEPEPKPATETETESEPGDKRTAPMERDNQGQAKRAKLAPGQGQAQVQSQQQLQTPAPSQAQMPVGYSNPAQTAYMMEQAKAFQQAMATGQDPVIPQAPTQAQQQASYDQLVAQSGVQPGAQPVSVAVQGGTAGAAPAAPQQLAQGNQDAGVQDMEISEDVSEEELVKRWAQQRGALSTKGKSKIITALATAKRDAATNQRQIAELQKQLVEARKLSEQTRQEAKGTADTFANLLIPLMNQMLKNQGGVDQQTQQALKSYDMSKPAAGFVKALQPALVRASAAYNEQQALIHQVSQSNMDPQLQKSLQLYSAFTVPEMAPQQQQVVYQPPPPQPQPQHQAALAPSSVYNYQQPQPQPQPQQHSVNFPYRPQAQAQPQPQAQPVMVQASSAYSSGAAGQASAPRTEDNLDSMLSDVKSNSLMFRESKSLHEKMNRRQPF